MFGSWKTKRWTSRTSGRRSNGWPNGVRGFVPDRAALAKVAITAAAAIATICVMEYGGIPFTFRIGQVSQRDIRAKVSFSRANQTRTFSKREQAADAVPPIYQNNPAPFEPLLASLDALAESLLACESFDQLPAALVSEWSLTPELFQLLRTPVLANDHSEPSVRALRSAIAALRGRGILDLNPVEQRPETQASSRIQVRTDGNEPVVYESGEVLRGTILDKTGPVTQLLAGTTGAPENAERLFEFIRPRLERLPGTLAFDAAATLAARQAARDVVPEERDMFEVGERIVIQDEPIREEILSLLEAEHEAWVKSKGGQIARFRRIPSLSALVLGLFGLGAFYISRFEPRIAASLPRVAVLGLLMVVSVAAAKRLHDFQFHLETLAIALPAMGLAIAYSQQFGLLVTFGLGLVTAWMFGTGMADFVVLTGGTSAAVLSLQRVRSRTKLITVGATAAALYFVLTWATGLLSNLPAQILLRDGMYRALWGIMAGFLMGGSLPFLEKLFGIVTDINLLEMSDVSHPLLLDLMRKAPGTYNHSVAVATLAESAAEQIGANPLVCRVGSYFHDVGKMLKPHYFVENQADSVKRHEALNPAMSTLIIIGHVKDGADLAHQHHLPKPIVDLIEQHHGTTLVEYFYKEATRDVEQDLELEADVEEAAFRYPGPKPQSKEACIVMLADAVESASRTLSEPTPGRIEGLVHELTLKRLLDGQFDECGITLQEIAQIKESLIKSVNAIYHGRVKYPEQRTA